MKRRHTIRPASSADAKAISRLLIDSGWELDLDLTDVAPFWYVAVIGDKVVGCIQIALSRPVGYLEMLSVDSGFTGFQKHAVVNDLLLTGLGIHMQNGAQLAGGVIPYDMPHYKKVLKKRGGRVISSGNMLMMDVRGPATGAARKAP